MRDIELLDGVTKIKSLLNKSTISMPEVSDFIKDDGLVISNISELDLVGDINDTLYAGNIFIMHVGKLYLSEEIFKNIDKLTKDMDLAITPETTSNALPKEILDIVFLGEVVEMSDLNILKEYKKIRLITLYRSEFEKIKLNSKSSISDYMDIVSNKKILYTGLTLVTLNISNKHISHIKLVINPTGAPMLSINLDKREGSEWKNILLDPKSLHILLDIYNRKGSLDLTVPETDLTWTRDVSRITCFNEKTKTHETIMDYLNELVH